jgi:hypothetical protein
MTILDVNGQDMAPQDPCVYVQHMLGKPIATLSKRELSQMIVAQYQAITNLVDALRKVDPDNKLLPKAPRRPADVTP